MEHVTLYRKYRPKDFSEMAGEIEILKTIKNSLKNNRMSHAYLFTGPRGVGKTTTARLIAKGLNCLDNGITDEPCGLCENCIAIEKGNFIDLIEIDAASNRGIDEIRALKDKINYQPVKGRKKVYIIDEVHMLTKEAFNALLKTLEEPPGHVVFILATTEPDKVLDTIISRCQRYDFLPVSLEEMSGKLSEIAKNEGITIEEDCYKIIHEKATGSMRDAISIFEKIVSYYLDQEIKLEDVEKVLGVIPRKKLEHFLDIIVENKSKDALVFLDELWENGLDVESFFKDFSYYLKKIILDDSCPLEMPVVVEIIESIYETINKFKYEEDKRLLGYLIVYKILDFGVSIKKIKITEEKVSNIPNEQVKIKEIQVEQNTDIISDQTSEVENLDIDIAEIKTKWNEILKEAGNRKVTLKAFLDKAIPQMVEEGVLIVTFPSDARFHKEMMEKREYGGVFEEAFREILNLKIKIEYRVADEGLRKGNVEGRSPLIEKIVDFFDGEIID